MNAIWTDGLLVAPRTKSLPSIGINELVRRQTLNSHYSHFVGNDPSYAETGPPGLGAYPIQDTWAELADLVQAAFLEGKEGYRPGVWLVPVNPEGFFTNIITLVEGDVLKGEFSPRRDGEDPRKSFTVIKKGVSTQAAESVNVVLYHKGVLAEDDDASTEAEWEIVSINAYPTEGGEGPMHPETLCRNHFGMDGGTATQMTNDEFVAALQTSFEFWADKAQLDPGK
jgi:hypothetical protein